MADMDQGIKRLLQTHPADVLALAVPGAEYLAMLPIDVATEPQLTLDTLLRARYQDVECAVDLEAEARPRPNISRRLFEYGARACIVTQLPVISVVLWLEPDGVAPTSPYELRVGDRLVAAWHFVGVELYRVPAQSLLEGGVLGLLPLVPFAQGGADLTVIERAAELVRERAPAAELGELEALLAVFASRTFDTHIVRNLLRRILMSTEIIGTSPLYQEWVREATEKGLQQGLEQGLEQGKAEGLREGTLMVLRSRFGELTPDLTSAISSADVPTLEAVLPHAARGTLQELRARFGLGGE